ncbi:MAG: hypothetical protein ACREGD_02920 [Candidatus Saccharimonadales bacterium]
MDFSGYQPQPQILERLRQVDFVAVVGPTAVGKSTLMILAAANHRNMRLIPTQTSRTPRPNEVDGVGIRFRTKQEMLERIANHQFVQVAPSLLGDIYATGPEDYPAEGIGMMAVLAEALETFRALPFRSFKPVFIVPASWERWQVQIKAHGFEPLRVAKRLKEAKTSFLFALHSAELTFVINDDVNRSWHDLAAVASGEPPGLRMQAYQQKARQIIQSILSKLG